MTMTLTAAATVQCAFIPMSNVVFKLDTILVRVSFLCSHFMGLFQCYVPYCSHHFESQCCNHTHCHQAIYNLHTRTQAHSVVYLKIGH